MWEAAGWMLLVIGGVFLLAAAYLVIRYFKLWLRSYVTKAKIGMISLVFMSLRKVNPHVIVDARVMAVQAGLTDVSTQALEAHFLAGGTSAVSSRR